MATLIAIGYPDETTAAAAASQEATGSPRTDHPARRHRGDHRDGEGKFHVTTNHHAVGGGATWGMFWGLLFGMLFFVPFLGMAVGAGLGALMGKVEKSGINKEFQEQVRDMLTARHVGAVPGRREGHARQGRRGAEPVRRHGAQVVAVQGGRGRAAGGAARQGAGRLRLGGRPRGALRPGRARRRAAPAVRPPSPHP